MISNAPIIFTGVYAIVKVWINEKTRKKINIVGGSFKKELLKDIDEDKLPTFLGGTNTHDLSDDWGPWNAYDIVDGYKMGDKVGIRKKDDGPNG